MKNEDGRTGSDEAERASTRPDPTEIRYQALFHGMDAGVVLMRDATAIDCNPAALRLFGVERRDQFIGRTPLDFAEPVQLDGRMALEMMRDNLEKAISRGSHQFEWLARKVNGEAFLMEVRLTPVRIGDELLFQCIAVDITERKRAEEALRESRRELATYHDLVTHDFANFSMTILGLLEELLDPATDLAGDSSATLLRGARRQAFEMSRLAENARLLSRLRDGKIVRPESPPSLERIFDAAIGTVRAIHFDREIELRVDGPREFAAFRLPLLDNVLMNLLDNAVRHSPRQRRVTIVVSMGRHETDPEGVRLRVTGGRPPEPALLSRLFERWSPGPGSGGSGLGLSLAREIVQRAGGKIDVEMRLVDNAPSFSVGIALPGTARAG